MVSERKERMLITVVSPDLDRPAQMAVEAVKAADAQIGRSFVLPVDGQSEDSEAAAAFGAECSALGPAEEEALVQACVDRWPNEAMRLLFMRRGLRDRWFSHWHDRHRTAVVSLHQWEAISRLPVAAIIASELVFFGLRTISEAYDPRRHLHPETRGCLFDFCEEKSDIGFKLRTGDVCPACRKELARAGVPRERVLRMLDAVRELAMGQ